MRPLLTVVVATALLAACQASRAGSVSSPPPSVPQTTGEVESTTTPPTTFPSTSTVGADNSGALGIEPEVTDEIISPASLTADYEDDGALIQRILDGAETATPSSALQQVVLDNLSPEALPYHYAAALADGLVVREQVSARLANRDSIQVLWRYRWSDTPGCDSCAANQLPWENGWLVWTQADPERGMIVYDASHPELPLSARIWFFPDPIDWPEATPESNPTLRTTDRQAETTAEAILTALAAVIPIPDG